MQSFGVKKLFLTRSFTKIRNIANIVNIITHIVEQVFLPAAPHELGVAEEPVLVNLHYAVLNKSAFYLWHRT